MTQQYAKRDRESLGPHYMRHLAAMTVEHLHSKFDIAAELAWRDAEIERLRSRLVRETGLTGDNCRRCGAPMGSGLAVVPYRDCSDEGTCSIAPGPATLTECRKCAACGWSTT